MKRKFTTYVLPILFACSLGSIQAQSFSVSLNLPSANLNHSRSRLLSDGKVLTVAINESLNSTHLVMLDPQGSQLWAKEYQGIKMEDIAELPSGNFAFAATKDYYYSAWGVIDASGNFVWGKQLYSNDWSYDLSSIDILKNGKILFNFSKYNRSVTVKCDEGGNTEDCDQGEDTLGMGKNPCFDSFACEDSGYVSCNKSDDRMMIVRHNAQGDVMWAKNYMKATTEYFHLKKIKELNDGSLMAVGLVNDYYTGTNNSGFIVKMNSNGEVMWTKKYILPPNPGYFSSTFRSFEIEENQLYISGYYTTDNANMINFLMKMDMDGNIITSKQMLSNTNALMYVPVPTMGAVTFEHDMKNHYLLYNNYSYEGNTSIELNKVSFDGTLGCNVTDFPVTTVLYNAFTNTQPALYSQISILETAASNITPLNLVVINSNIDQSQACAFVAGMDDETGINHISVYPNPSNEYFNIGGLNSEGEYTIQVMDITGKIAQTHTGINGVETTLIRTESLTQGSYIINITDVSSNKMKQVKWMKM